jgi:hypothetical protein
MTIDKTNLVLHLILIITITINTIIHKTNSFAIYGLVVYLIGFLTSMRFLKGLNMTNAQIQVFLNRLKERVSKPILAGCALYLGVQIAYIISRFWILDIISILLLGGLFLILNILCPIFSSNIIWLLRQENAK